MPEDKRKQVNIECPYDNKLRCTLLVPSTVCLECEHYIKSKNCPGAVKE